MDEEQKQWQEKFWNNSGGTREVLRVGCAFVIWHVIGLGRYLWSGNMSYMLIWIAIYLSLIAFSTHWRPAYSLLRKILGNENLPTEPMPRSIAKIRREPLPWWGYLLGIWHWLLLLLLLYIILKR